MNFRWNNIYVLQFLMVLDVNALKLVPADRTVIKENGTTHTIARYFVLPNEDKNNLYSAGDAVFSKFLREFDKNNEVKNAQPEKKIVDRYRIYIKRKLKNVNKDVSKFGGNSENTSSTTEAIEKNTIPVKVITYDTPLTEIVTDNNEYIVKKKQLNLNAAFPELQDKKHLQTLESKESLLDVKDPYEILKTAAALQAQKQQADRQGNQNIDIPQTKVILLMSKGGKIKENTNGGETEEDTIVTIDQDGSPIKLNKPLEALSQVEVNDLYAQLYDKYIPEKSNDSEPDMKIQRQNLNVGVDETAKQVPENLKTGTAIEELSVIHDTPQNYTEQAVTDTILDQYNPSEEKESAGEYKYEGFDKLLVYQTHRPPFLKDNYNIATQDSLKSKEIQQLTITDAEYSNNITPRSLLESNYIKYGIQNDSEPEIKLQRQDLNVGVNETANLVPENLKNGTAIEKSLIIHDTPQKYTEQAVTDTILDQYNPSEEKESAGEYKYEGFDELLVYQTHRPPFLEDNYDIATQDSVKSKEIQQLTITSANYSDTKPTSLLESNYIKYGIPDDSEPEKIIQRQELNIGVDETAKYVQENLKNKTAIEQLSVIHDTPQKYTEQAVTDTILDQYNPSEEKESAGEYKYEGFDELLVYQTHRPPFLRDSYDITTQDAVKSKEKSKSNLLTPVLNDVPAGDYLKTPRSLNSVNTNLSLANDDDAKYKFSTADILPTTKNSGSTTISENSTTDDNTLRGGMGDEWTTVYQEVGVNDKQYPSQPNIKIATNLVQIGAEDEVESYHAPNTFDLATVCPKCFQKIRAEPIHKLETTGTDEVDGSVTGNTQLSSLYSQLLAQQQQGGDGSGSIWSILSLLYPTLLISGLSSLLSSINPEDILELMQNLNTQKQQVHLNPEDDQTLLKILEIVMELKDSVLKDSDGKFSTNLEEAGAAIFTIQNLRNVLEALENRIEIQPDIDRETANLYVIIKIIFDTAMKQTQVAIANEQENSEEIWYKQLTAYRANPIMNYVYNLIRQTWLQEIMFELYYNNYNLNVIRNRRWADYLRAWHLPIYLVKYINAVDNYDQNEYTDQYDDYIQKVYYFQNDANVILNFLRNYLIGMQYYEPNTMEYYRKQTEVFSGIAAFMRQRGYSVHVIHNLIQKLYALLNANKTSVTLTRPSCLTRQQL